MRVIAVLTMLLAFVQVMSAQTYNDGPVELQVRVRDVRVEYSGSTSSDFNINFGNLNPFPNFAEDELTFKVWVQDNADVDGVAWQGGTCMHDSMAMATGGPEFSRDFNESLFNYTYTGASVPQFVDLRVDAWEDDIPTDFTVFGGLASPCSSTGSFCDFHNNVSCVFGLINEGDDYRCNAQPFVSGLDYRYNNATSSNIPPCRWFSHGYVAGSCPSNNFYRPNIETFWRYTKGTACNQTDAIDIGTLSSGNPLSHFNSNECYSNNFPNAGGNDVFYTFDIATNIGVTINLAAACPVSATFNTKVYLLDNNCTVIDSATGNCGNAAIIDKALCNVGSYYVVVDGANPTDDGAFTLSVTENPSFSLSATIIKTNVSCNGLTDGTAKAVVTGGLPPYTYSWGGSLQSVDSIGGLAAGTYTVTVTDDEGCSTTAQVQITEPQVLAVTATAQDASCGGTNDGSATASVTGGTTPYQYVWNTTPQQTSATAVLLPTGTYTVVITDANGCTATTTATVNQATNIVLTADAVDNVSCNGANDGAISISISGGVTPYTFAWNNGLPATEDQTGLAPGNYSVTVTDGAGCLTVGNFVVNEPSALSSSISFVQDASCPGAEDGSADLEVTGGTPPYSYNWSNGDATGSLFDVAEGTYTVTVTDDSGCTITDAVNIGGPVAGLSSSLTKTDANCAENITGSVDLTVTGGDAPYSFFWSNFASTEDVSGLSAGTYSVIISDAGGCSIVDTVTIAELAPGGSCGGGDTIREVAPWFIPNVFTPNGDNVNDIFELFVRDPASVEVRIFNRLGAQVYYNANQTSGSGWDGRHNGDEAPEGTYVYMIYIDYEDAGEQDRQLTGSITLIR